MTRVRKLYKSWKKDNKQFFALGNIKQEYIQDAKNSLLIYLRQNNVTITEAQFTISEIINLWDIVMYFASGLAGTMTGSLAAKTYTVGEWIFWGLIGGLVFYYALSWVIKRIVHELTFSPNTLLQAVLESYKEMYANEMDVDKKIATLWNGQSITFSRQVEELYEQKMRNPKYYRNAYLISIHNDAQGFEYIWYTNTKYKKLNPNTIQKFTDICEEQIGMKWHNIDAAKITIEDLPYVTIPTSG